MKRLINRVCERLLFQDDETVVKIKGWNCFLVDGPGGQRSSSSPVWDWLRIKDVIKRLFIGQPKQPPKPEPFIMEWSGYWCGICGTNNCTAGHW